jgi:peptidoglycan/LPS O-acetylase OafA/YrhL
MQTTAAPLGNSNRIPGLDGLRAISICLVMFNHVASAFPLSSYGVFGVSVFFVISGFLITWLMCSEERKHGAVSIRSFYVRRALRILPPAFVFLAALQILGWLGLADVGRYDVFYCAVFVRNIFGSGVHSAHFWSLSVEEQFYLAWPLLFILLRTNRLRLIFASGLFIVLPFWQHFVFVAHHGAQFVNPQRFDMRCGFILAGCALALANYHPRLVSILKRMASPIAGVAFALLCAWAISPFFPLQALSGAAAAASVAMVVNSAIQSRYGFLNWALFVWVGNLSYSIYLWQQVFCLDSHLRWFGTFPVNVLSSIAVACGSFYLIEKPLAKLRSRVPHFPNPAILQRLNPTIFEQDKVVAPASTLK